MHDSDSIRTLITHSPPIWWGKSSCHDIMPTGMLRFTSAPQSRVCDFSLCPYQPYRVVGAVLLAAPRLHPLGRDKPRLGSGEVHAEVPEPRSELRHKRELCLSNKPAEAEEKPRPKVTFNVDDTVKINEGAFMGLTGLVSMVDPDKGKLKVEVSVFSRKVPVDVDYWQVEKVAVEDMAAEPPVG